MSDGDGSTEGGGAEDAAVVAAAAAAATLFNPTAIVPGEHGASSGAPSSEVVDGSGGSSPATVPGAHGASSLLVEGRKGAAPAATTVSSHSSGGFAAVLAGEDNENTLSSPPQCKSPPPAPSQQEIVAEELLRRITMRVREAYRSKLRQVQEMLSMATAEEKELLEEVRGILDEVLEDARKCQEVMHRMRRTSVLCLRHVLQISTLLEELHVCMVQMQLYTNDLDRLEREGEQGGIRSPGEEEKNGEDDDSEWPSLNAALVIFSQPFPALVRKYSTLANNVLVVGLLCGATAQVRPVSDVSVAIEFIDHSKGAAPLSNRHKHHQHQYHPSYKPQCHTCALQEEEWWLLFRTQSLQMPHMRAAFPLRFEMEKADSLAQLRFEVCVDVWDADAVVRKTLQSEPTHAFGIYGDNARMMGMMSLLARHLLSSAPRYTTPVPMDADHVAILTNSVVHTFRTLLTIAKVPSSALSGLGHEILERIMHFASVQVAWCEAINAMQVVVCAALGNGRQLDARDLNAVFRACFPGNKLPRKILLNMEFDVPFVWRMMLSIVVILQCPTVNTLWKDGVVYGVMSATEAGALVTRKGEVGCAIVFVALWPQRTFKAALMAAWLASPNTVSFALMQDGTVANQCVASAISEEIAIERVLVPTQDASIPKSIALESVI